jgi:hypothetical protein
MKRIALVLMVLSVFVGLAVAAPPPPALLKIGLPFEGPVALGVLDARPDVVSGERKETFVGFSRSLYGIPYPAHTQSKKPFAQDLSNLVARALKLGGVKTQPISTSPFGGRQGAVQALQKTGAERLILIEIRDWWSDTLIHTDLHYDLGLTVLNQQGQELGSSSLTGHDELGKRQRPERRDVTTATNDIIATLLAADAVLASFSPDASPVPAKTAGCTVEQILKMKEAGLSQGQIEAACGSGR